MFEVWANQEDPMLRLVVGAGAPIPAELASRDWSRLGTCSIPEDVGEQVRSKGYALVRSSVPFRDGAALVLEPGPLLSAAGLGNSHEKTRG